MIGQDIPARVAALLREAEGGSLPLSRVYVALVAEGAGAGSYAQLRSELARRSDLFLLLESRHPLGSVAWTGAVHGEYEAALVAAGVDAGPRVALAPRPRDPASPVVHVDTRVASPGDPAEDSEEDPRMLRRLDVSLVKLWAAAGDDAVLRAELLEAMSLSEEIRRALEAPSHGARQ